MPEQDPDNTASWAERILKFFMVLCMFVMSVLVFINVILRYGFNSNLIATEEIARYAFVWMTFLGSILAFARHNHVRMDVVMNLLRGRVRKVVVLIGHVLVLLCCYLIVRGCYELATLNLVNRLPVTGLSVAWLYIPGVPFGVSVAGMTLFRMFTLFRGQNEGEAR